MQCKWNGKSNVSGCTAFTFRLIHCIALKQQSIKCHASPYTIDCIFLSGHPNGLCVIYKILRPLLWARGGGALIFFSSYSSSSFLLFFGACVWTKIWRKKNCVLRAVILAKNRPENVFCLFVCFFWKLKMGHMSGALMVKLVGYGSTNWPEKRGHDRGTRVPTSKASAPPPLLSGLWVRINHLKAHLVLQLRLVDSVWVVFFTVKRQIGECNCTNICMRWFFFGMSPSNRVHVRPDKAAFRVQVFYKWLKILNWLKKSILVDILKFCSLFWRILPY